MRSCPLMLHEVRSDLYVSLVCYWSNLCLSDMETYNSALETIHSDKSLKEYVLAV